MKKYLTEFIGTFFLVTVFCLTNGNYLAPVAVGFMLTAIIYLGHLISGAHYNPATTIAFLFSGKITFKDSLLYIIVQLTAGIGGALVYFLIWGRNSGIPRPNMEINILKPLFIESLLTYIMVLVIFFVSATKRTKGNSYYGIAIGLTYTAIVIAGGPISGGAFNPAIGLGPMIIDDLMGTCPCNPFEYGWIYIAGPLSGAIAAAITFKIISPEDFIKT